MSHAGWHDAARVSITDETMSKKNAAYDESSFRVLKGLEPEIRLAFRAVHAVEERGDFDQLVAGVEEIEVQHLGTRHRHGPLDATDGRLYSAPGRFAGPDGGKPPEYLRESPRIDAKPGPAGP